MSQMISTEFLTGLLHEFEHRLELCSRCRACLAGVMAALKAAVAEAAGPAGGDGLREAGMRREFARIRSLVSLQPWEKIHV